MVVPVSCEIPDFFQKRELFFTVHFYETRSYSVFAAAHELRTGGVAPDRETGRLIFKYPKRRAWLPFLSSEIWTLLFICSLFNDSGATSVHPKGELYLMVSKVEQEELRTTCSVSLPSLKLPLHDTYCLPCTEVAGLRADPFLIMKLQQPKICRTVSSCTLRVNGSQHSSSPRAFLQTDISLTVL